MALNGLNWLFSFNYVQLPCPSSMSSFFFGAETTSFSDLFLDAVVERLSNFSAKFRKTLNNPPRAFGNRPEMWTWAFGGETGLSVFPGCCFCMFAALHLLQNGSGGEDCI